MDIGLLILRLAVGLLLAGHGVQKLFGWFGGPGLTGAGGFFEMLGYRPGRRNAALAGLTEAGAGLLLVLGLVTPLAAAAAVGVVVNIILGAHRGKGLWATNGGYEYPLLLGVAAAVLAFTGAGEVSLDGALDWDLAGPEWGGVAVAVGLAAGFAMLSTRRSEPETVSGDGTATVTKTEIDADRVG